MKHIFKIALFAAFMLNLTASANAATTSVPVPSASSLKLAKLVVEFSTPLNAIMTWGILSGTGPYYVGVYDLTDGIRVTAFQTTDRKAEVGVSATGHTYRFTVQRGVNTLEAIVSN
jgi:hypothetical protein